MKNLEILVQDTKDILDELNIPYGPILDVTINYRAKSRWGRCTRVYNGYKIEISSILIEDDRVSWESAINILIHEFLHAHKNRMCHTGEWKRCANLVNREFPQYHIERTTSAMEMGIPTKELEPNYKYFITCNNCGSVAKYMKKSKAVTHIARNPLNSGYTCRKCGGKKFTVTSNNYIKYV